MRRKEMKKISIPERKYSIALEGEIDETTGKGNGTFYLVVSKGNPNVQPGDYKIGMRDAKSVFMAKDPEKAKQLAEFLVL
ncbi:MAG: hypothetical protein U9Q37_00975 [Euryarchaeota archaeon]|nr:hypothetical protein [Euryarchaeota archaeon]